MFDIDTTYEFIQEQTNRAKEYYDGSALLRDLVWNTKMDQGEGMAKKLYKWILAQIIKGKDEDEICDELAYSDEYLKF